MKSKFIKINKPCSEKWENMKPNEKASFCDLCSKNVIDLTKLNQVEITKILKNENKNSCVRLNRNQLNTPLLNSDTRKDFKLPFSNIAAGVMIATALTACETSPNQNVEVKTEFVQNSSSNSTSKKVISKSKTIDAKTKSYIIFYGKVKNEFGDPIENAKISFVSISKMLKTFTLNDGSFSLQIPTELVDNDNVISVLYHHENQQEDERAFMGYEAENYILSKKEIKSNYGITAIEHGPIAGKIGYDFVKNYPIVISNGKKISYDEFSKALRGKKSSCNLENKDFSFYESKIAMAIYGKEAKYGLYIVSDKFEVE